MYLTYADIEMLIEEESEQSWEDRPARLPMLGFVLGTTVSLAMWALIGWGAWTLIA